MKYLNVDGSDLVISSPDFIQRYKVLGLASFWCVGYCKTGYVKICLTSPVCFLSGVDNLLYVDFPSRVGRFSDKKFGSGPYTGSYHQRFVFVLDCSPCGLYTNNDVANFCLSKDFLALLEKKNLAR